MIALLLNHLWQSSVCAAGAALLALAMRRNGANVRFWLWFAASIKFLVPYSALTMLGASLLTLVAAPVTAPTLMLMKPLAQPFSAAPSAVTAIPEIPVPPARLDVASAFLALWVTGFLILALRWTVRWMRVRALLNAATRMQVDAPVAVKFSSSRLEPGLVGILRPVILLPNGIEQQLSAAELKAVLAHELCHWRRNDNLLAAIHMLVEALFWFFPLVWWLGARLNAERERACDESVVGEGNDPQVYAEGILKVCRAYLQSPMTCIAGVSGAGLKERIEALVENRLTVRLNAARKLVLSALAAAAVVLPLTLGLAAVPAVQMQARAATPLRPVVPKIVALSQPIAALPSEQPAKNQEVPQIVRATLTTRGANSPPERGDGASWTPPSPATSTQPLTSEAPAPEEAVAQNEVAAPPVSREKPVVPELGVTQAPPAEAVQDSSSSTLAAIATQLGKGPPDSVVCLPEQPQTSTHRAVPRICIKNWEWAEVKAGKVCVSKDGERIMSCWMDPPPYRYSNWGNLRGHWK